MHGKTLFLSLTILMVLIIGAALAVVSKNCYVLSINDFAGAVTHSMPKQANVKVTFKPAPPEGAAIRTEEEMQRVLQGDVYVAEFGEPGRAYWKTDEATYVTRGTQPGSYHATRWANKELFFGEDSLTQWRKNETTAPTFKHRDWHSNTLLFFPEAGGVWVIQFPEDWNPNGETRQLTATVH